MKDSSSIEDDFHGPKLKVPLFNPATYKMLYLPRNFAVLDKCFKAFLGCFLDLG